jgi:hypothetical protein
MQSPLSPGGDPIGPCCAAEMVQRLLVPQLLAPFRRANSSCSRGKPAAACRFDCTCCALLLLSICLYCWNRWRWEAQCCRDARHMTSQQQCRQHNTASCLSHLRTRLCFEQVNGKAVTLHSPEEQQQLTHPLSLRQESNHGGARGGRGHDLHGHRLLHGLRRYAHPKSAGRQAARAQEEQHELPVGQNCQL